MALTARQELAYNHLVDLYEPSTAIVGGKPQPTTYTKHPNVRCRIEIKQSPSSPSPMGRIETDIVVAIDTIAFAEDQAVDDGWWLENKTLRPDGSQSNMYGRFWVIRGEPQRFVDSTRRRGGKISVMASQESRPPEGLPL